MYKIKLDKNNFKLIIRDFDNAIIPLNKDNVDYQTYLAWVEEGNVAQEINSGGI
jgi:predicted HAD superfamily phosphohydrolase YqeG